MKTKAKPFDDPLWELTTRLIEKRTRPGDSIKSILRDLRLLYTGLKRIARKHAFGSITCSITEMDRKKALSTIESIRAYDSPAQTRNAQGQAVRSAKS